MLEESMHNLPDSRSIVLDRFVPPSVVLLDVGVIIVHLCVVRKAPQSGS